MNKKYQMCPKCKKRLINDKPFDKDTGKILKNIKSDKYYCTTCGMFYVLKSAGVEGKQ